ncbi:MAG TPA: head GIN domain-containing protein, partial [Chitinophagaceae bacterium]|nr:head GIN domain-containing protein [Chitinophagaceae bacterium]
VLKISYDYKNKLGWNITSGKMKLKAYVSFKTLDKLNASGGSDVWVDGTLKASRLDIRISGGADFVGKVDATDLDVEASGGSDMHISGSAKKLTIEASGGSDVKGFDLSVETCNANASGGSDIQISASKELNIDANGGSDVHYKGNAVIKDIKTSGGGSVKKVSK